MEERKQSDALPGSVTDDHCGSLHGLAPCPFCGNPNPEIRVLDYIGDYYVICISDEMWCGASSSEHSCETEAGAIRRWNRRAPDPRIAAMRAALERIASGEVEVHDDDLDALVIVSMDGEEAAEIARAAIAKAVG